MVPRCVGALYQCSLSLYFFAIPTAIFFKASLEHSSNSIYTSIKSFMKTSLPFEILAKYPSNLSPLGKYIGSVPFLNQSSFTPNSLHIEVMAASIGVLRPISYVATVFRFTPNLFANCSCVSPASFRIFFILSFKLSLPFCISQSYHIYHAKSIQKVD